MLNMYVVGGLAPKAKLAMYFAVNTFSGFINAVNAAIYDKTNGPSIISISWGAIDSAWGLNRNAMDSVLQSAVALGITVTVAAGNGGARATATSPVYTVQYPASSPYVLACGGTSLALNEDGTIASEVPWNNGYGASSGGVSTIYNLPSYQSNLQTTVYPNGSPIALSKRGVPDISAVADPLTGYQFYFGTSNTFQPNGGGTSAVAPMYAGLFARINQLTGKRIGFLNSIFYSNTSAFNDITIGNNAYLSPQGYSATIGWDAVTGLGSPIGTEIYKLLNTGTIYPDYTTGFRPTSGTVYPRIKTTIL
jgi:kumamolisin